MAEPDRDNAEIILPHPIEFTLAKSLGGRVMAKTISATPEECRPYDNGYLFDFKAASFATLERFARALEKLATEPDLVLIRNALRDGRKELRAARRLLKDSPATATQPASEATFETETARAVLTFDIDGIPVPEKFAGPNVLGLSEKELREGLAFIFPPELQDVDWLLSVSASTGRKPGALHLRAFVPLAAPIKGDDAKAYTIAHAAEHRLFLDSSVCVGVQPIYTARPLFTGGGVRDEVLTLNRVRIVRGTERAGTLAVGWIKAGRKILAEDKKVAKRLDKDWRGYLREAIGGPLSYRRPLETAIGLAVRCGESEEAVVDFCVGLLAEKADAARARRYDSRWISEAYRSFARRDEEGGGEASGARRAANENYGAPPPDNDERAAAAACAADDDQEYRQYLRSSRGAILLCLANVLTAIRKNPHIAEALRFDLFKNSPVLHAPIPATHGEPVLPGPYPRKIIDADALALCTFLQYKLRVPFGLEIVQSAIDKLARVRSYHPLQDYLNGLKWDGVSRIDRWLSTYIGAEDDEYAKLVGPKFLIGMAARGLAPGCKMDNLLVFEGPQGRLKSTAASVLGGEWFSDDLPDIQDKDAKAHLAGKWLIEITELAAVRKAHSEHIKSYFTAQVDRFRAAYDRRETEQPRGCVFIGTANNDDYLKDATGGRRFWPVRCGEIDVAALRKDRDQLFAEAVARYRKGEAWWIESAVQHELATSEQADRMETSVLDEQVLEILDSWTEETATFSDVAMRLYPDVAGVSRAAERTRLVTTLGPAMRKAGWLRIQKGKYRVKCWVRGPEVVMPKPVGAPHPADEDLPF